MILREFLTRIGAGEPETIRGSEKFIRYMQIRNECFILGIPFQHVITMVVAGQDFEESFYILKARLMSGINVMENPLKGVDHIEKIQTLDRLQDTKTPSI